MSAGEELSYHFLYDREFHFYFGLLSLVLYNLCSSLRKLERLCANYRAEDATSTALCTHIDMEAEILYRELRRVRVR